MQSDNAKNLIYQTGLHGVYFFWPVVLLCVFEYLGYQFESLRVPSTLLALISCLWGLFLMVPFKLSSLTIKKTHVILRSGIFVRQTVDIPLNKIESIDIRQSLLGSLLRYGTLRITGTGGTQQFINYLRNPLTCRRYIEQLMHGDGASIAEERLS